MFFIHNNDSNIFKGGKDGSPRPHSNLPLSLQDSPPLIITLSPSKPAMKESQVFSETILESGKKLRRQGYLRNKDNCLSSLSQHLFNGSKINLGLPASCHTIKQKGRKPLRMDPLEDLTEHSFLIRSGFGFWIRLEVQSSR